MIYALITALSALGLGMGSASMRLFSGLLVIPIGLFFGNLWLKVPLTTCSRLLAGAGILRLLLWLKSQKLSWPNPWVHPSIIFSLIYFPAYFLFVKKPFNLHEWDEFSNWGLMPKQILLFDKITSPSFPLTRFLEYTPGWPLLLDYPYLVMGSEFKTDFLIFTVFLLGVAFLGFTWSTLKALIPSSVFTWATLLVLARVIVGPSLYPTQILSELPMEIFFCGAALIGLRWVFEVERGKTEFAFWGLLLCAGYLTKKSYLATLVFFIWLSFQIYFDRRKATTRGGPEWGQTLLFILGAFPCSCNHLVPGYGRLP